MFNEFATAKLHGVFVTDAVLHYKDKDKDKNSIAIDRLLLEAAGIQAGMKVHVNNFENGQHWETYVFAAPEGSGTICLNGPPAHLFARGNKIVVVLYSFFEEKEYLGKEISPTVVFVDEKNHITEVRKGQR